MKEDLLNQIATQIKSLEMANQGAAFGRFLMGHIVESHNATCGELRKKFIDIINDHGKNNPQIHSHEGKDAGQGPCTLYAIGSLLETIANGCEMAHEINPGVSYNEMIMGCAYALLNFTKKQNASNEAMANVPYSGQA